MTITRLGVRLIGHSSGVDRNPPTRSARFRLPLSQISTLGAPLGMYTTVLSRSSTAPSSGAHGALRGTTDDKSTARERERCALFTGPGNL